MMPAIKCPVPGCSFSTQEDAVDASAASHLRTHVDQVHGVAPPVLQMPLQAPTPQQVQYCGFSPQQQPPVCGYNTQQQVQLFGYAGQQVQQGYGPQPGHGPQFVQSSIYSPLQASATGFIPHIPPTSAINAAYVHTPPPHQRPLQTGINAPPSAHVSLTGCIINNTTNIMSQNNYTAINSNIEHLGPKKIVNTYIEKVTVELGVKKEEAETFMSLLGDEGDRGANLQKLIFLKKENKMQLPTVSKMTRSTCLVRYLKPEPHGGTKWGTKWHGTGFISTLPISGFKGAVLFSAGHNFEDNGELLQDFQNFSFIFNNSPGVVDPSKAKNDADEKNIITKTMEEFMREFTCTIVINCKGKKLIKKTNEPAILTQHHNKELDYFALILHDEKSQENLREQNLELLETASEAELKNCSGDPVFIFGHPGLKFCSCCRGKCSCEDANPPCLCEPRCHHPACSCRHPLRFSYGITKKEKIKNSIYYKMDTEGGNSGSPITGKKYTVLGIHVSDTLKEYNKAQSLIAVLKDLASTDSDCQEDFESSDIGLQKILNNLKHQLKI